MAAYDNVSLPGAPNIATAGNYAQMLMQGLSQLPQDYYRGQQSQYQQRQNNLFQGGVPTDANGNVDYNALIKPLLQSGGAPAISTAAQLLPVLQRQQLINSYLGNDQPAQPGGGQPPQVNTGPASSTAAASPVNITGSRIPYSNPSTLSSGGGDNSGAETVRTLTAGIASGRAVPDASMANYARALGVDPDTPLSADQEARARKIIGNNLSGGSQPMGSASAGGLSGAPQANPVPQAGLSGADENNTNQGTPVGATGGPAISPAPTTGAGGFRPSASGTIAGTPAGSNPPSGAAAMVPPQFRANPQAFADFLHERARQLRESSKTKVGELLGVRQDTLRDDANKLDERAKAIEEQLGKDVGETTEQKNVRGATAAQKQAEADIKYYDTLHRGLSGSAMIAAQQKQNIDVLRQVAAAPSFTPGAGSDLALAYQRLAAQFGINPTGAAPREIFNQVAARILADQFSGIKSLASETGEQGGRIFKPMLDIEEKANITPQDSLEGVKAKLDLLDKTGDLMMRWADKADEYKISHGRLDPAFDKALRADIAKARIPNAVPSKTSPGAPPVGHIEAGFRFKGGDHRKRENWEPAR